MNSNNLVYPFFSEKEILENVTTVMLMAQDELYKRVNRVNEETNINNTDLTKEQFIALLQSSQNLQDILREAVITAVNLIDWERCCDIATANLITNEKEEQLRRSNIKLSRNK